MSTDNNDAKVECTEQPGENKELTGARKWISENLLLLLTLFGVAFGTIVGESRTLFYLSKNYRTLLLLLIILAIDFDCTSLLVAMATCKQCRKERVFFRNCTFCSCVICYECETIKYADEDLEPLFRQEIYVSCKECAYKKEEEKENVAPNTPSSKKKKKVEEAQPGPSTSKEFTAGDEREDPVKKKKKGRCAVCQNLQPAFRVCCLCGRHNSYYCVQMDCWKIAGVQKLEDEKTAMWICYVCLPDRKIPWKNQEKHSRCHDNFSLEQVIISLDEGLNDQLCQEADREYDVPSTKPTTQNEKVSFRQMAHEALNAIRRFDNYVFGRSLDIIAVQMDAQMQNLQVCWEAIQTRVQNISADD